MFFTRFVASGEGAAKYPRYREVERKQLYWLKEGVEWIKN
jgi:hypothetical protein